MKNRYQRQPSSSKSEKENFLEKNPVLVGLILTLFTSIITICGFGFTYWQIWLNENHRQEDKAAQIIRDKSQDSLIKSQHADEKLWKDQQTHFNTQQIDAIVEQAKAAKNLNKFQIQLYKQQLYETEPRFGKTAHSLDSTGNFYRFGLSFLNIGSRFALVDSTNLYLYNKQYNAKKCWWFRWNSEMGPQSSEKILTILIPKMIFKDYKTSYCLRVFYHDYPNKIQLHKDLFFNYYWKHFDTFGFLNSENEEHLKSIIDYYIHHPKERDIISLQSY